jgi:ATP-dependent RNA helicase DeaD
VLFSLRNFYKILIKKLKKMTFDELGLKPEILAAVESLGFKEPSPIQEKAIPEILNNDGDLVGVAQTGTGKTAAFGLPMVNEVDFSSKKTQGLVICPTRELCIQIAKDFERFAKNFKGANIVPVYGGASIDTQSRQLNRGAQIVVATPGRLMDMIKRKRVNLSEVQYVALDEADEMLNMGFKEDIDAILDSTPDEKRVWLFSATMPREVARIAKNYMTKPAEISVGTKNASAKNIEHIYYAVSNRDRYNALKRVIDFAPNIYGLIFCRTRRETQEVAEKLIRDGYSADPIHGDLSQAQRDRVMKNFRDKNIQILVATDVAARGIDVNDISHVINYNIPDEIESYTHRSGRTARAGRKGISIIIVTPSEARKIKQIERIISTEFKKGEVPSGEEVCEKQLMHLVDKIVATKVDEEQVGNYLPAIEEKFADFSREEIIKQFVSAEFNQLLSYYKNSKDINLDLSKNHGRDRDDRGRGRGRDRGNDRRRNDRGNDRRRGDRDDRSRGRDFEAGRDRRSRGRDSEGGGYNRNLRDDDSATIFVNVGLKDVTDKGHLIRIICEEGGVAGKNIGKIRMMDKFSFIDVNTKIASKVIQGINGLDVDGRSMRAEISNK